MNAKTKILLATLQLFFITSVVIAQNELQPRAFLNNKIELLIPKSFEMLSKQFLDVKYPDMNSRPDVALTDKSTEINIIIDHQTQPLTENNIEEMKNYQVQSLKESLPGSVWKGEGIRMINGKKVGYFKFVANRGGDNIFNYFFFTNLDGRVLLITFNCTEKKLPAWENTAEKIVASFKML